ncbi:MAG TPA: 50S ribosomal protein L25 [Candidatus Dormibacteraeota bacterium]|nr:50S ribosomal protein L25 [Candidatus Dormibacteraeota bacterium]
MDLKLKASKRTVNGRHVRKLRTEGVVPGVVYGHRSESEAVTLDAAEFRRVFARAGRTHLVDLEMDGGRAQKVLIKEVQTHPRFDGAQHVDLFRIDLKEKLQIDVPVTIVGESPAVKRGDGDLLISLHAVRVECLPSDIPEAIEVDVAGLKEVDDAVRVHDLKFPDGVTILTGGDEMIVKVQAHRVAEEPVAEAAEGEEAVAEGEEGAEGEAGAAEPEASAE